MDVRRSPGLDGVCPAHATGRQPARRPRTYSTTSSGHQLPTETGYAAAGRATLAVDEAAGSVSLELRVRGIALDGLWKRLVAMPIGPLHLHLYLRDGNAGLILPFPYGPSYVATTVGFEVRPASRATCRAHAVGAARQQGRRSAGPVSRHGAFGGPGGGAFSVARARART